MKQLSIEEKAKAYDKALEIAKEMITDLRKGEDILAVSELETMFPELKESEDERIRKEIIEFVKTRLAGFPQCGKYLAWLEKQNSDVDNANKEYWRGYREGKQEILDKYAELEKQGEQKPFDYENANIQRKDFAPKSAMEAINEQKVDNANKVEPKDYSSIDPHFGKPIEQKSDDKVEPKFHEGDWCIDKEDCTIFFIKRVLGNTYKYITDAGREYSCTHYSLENDARLWTISDAKDGDVLADKDNNIGIYKGIEDIDWDSYIYLGCDGKLRGFSIGGKHEQLGTHPATKEQRDQLEKAIADAGFTFDFEKKELNKIEDKPKPKNFKQQVMSEMCGLVKDYIQQKPTSWSEEDEKRVESLHGWLDTLVNYIHHDAIVSLDLRRERMQQVEQLKTWLKSIRPQK